MGKVIGFRLLPTIIGFEKVSPLRWLVNKQNLWSDWLKRVARVSCSQSESPVTRNDTTRFHGIPESNWLCSQFSEELLLDTFRVWVDKKKAKFGEFPLFLQKLVRLISLIKWKAPRWLFSNVEDQCLISHSLCGSWGFNLFNWRVRLLKPWVAHGKWNALLLFFVNSETKN